MKLTKVILLLLVACLPALASTSETPLWQLLILYGVLTGFIPIAIIVLVLGFGATIIKTIWNAVSGNVSYSKSKKAEKHVDPDVNSSELEEYYRLRTKKF